MDNQTETPEGRTISFEMTWRGAAQIIAAALENGTGEGRNAARAELFRMAEILDQLKAEQADAAPVPLWEVITTTSTGQSFGQTFHSETIASDYAAAMETAGYQVDDWPTFETQTSLKTALTHAAEFYGHPEIVAHEADAKKDADQ